MVTQTQNRQARRAAASRGDQEPVAPKHDIPAAAGNSQRSIFDIAKPSNRLVAKQQLLGTVRQQLAEVTDLIGESGEQQERLAEVAGNAGTLLYNGMAS